MIDRQPSARGPARGDRPRVLITLTVLTALVALLGLAPAAADDRAAPPQNATLPLVEWNGERAPGWEKVEALVSQQKMRAALERAEALLAAAREAGDSQGIVHGLVRCTQLRTGLHGYEKAVRFLRQEPWPADLLARTTLELYYAASLIHYAQAYSWEIRQRERVAGDGSMDLKAWTMGQIHTAAHRALARLWPHRRRLGDVAVAELEAYLLPNTFPEGIRPSLRDALSYLWVALLADTQGWKPAQQALVYQLDPAALLASPQPGGMKPADPNVHPLRRIAQLLDDLERHHAGADRPQAALEARLERQRRLHAAFESEDARARIRADLRRRLETIRGRKWWAVGMAQLVHFVRAEPAADNLIRARRIAIRCQQQGGAGIGVERCRHLQAAIEAPAFELEGMAQDGPGQRSLGLRHKNLEAIHFRAWRLDLQRTVSGGKEHGLLPRGRRLEALVKNRRPQASWSVALQPPPDYKLHRRYLVPPLKRPGLWAVLASVREDFARQDNQLQGRWLIISDLVLTHQNEYGRLRARVVSGETGRPVAGAQVLLYKRNWRRGHRVLARRTTGADGEVTFRANSHSLFLLARRGRQQTLDRSSLSAYRHHQQRTHQTMLFTDRAIYRPGQQLHFKALVYGGRPDRADYAPLAGHEVRVRLLDPNRQQVAALTLETNAFGTAAGSLPVPAGRSLGRWRLTAHPYGKVSIRVEEYKRPTFEVELLDPAQPLRLNRPAVLRGRARYYFGQPLDGGRLRWRVVRRPVFPWWWGLRWGAAAAGAREHILAAGSAELDADGGFAIQFTPAADESLDRRVSYHYRLRAEVTEAGGETRTARRDFRLGFCTVEARIRSETGFLRAGRPAVIEVRRTDLDGAAAAGQGRWELVALDPPATTPLPADLPPQSGPAGVAGFRSPDDGRRPRWDPGYRPEAFMRAWPAGAEAGSGTLVHDETEGLARLELSGLAPGAYRLHYATTDPYGAVTRTRQELVVAGEGFDLPLPALLRVEHDTRSVGQTARVLVHSGLPDQLLFLDRYRAGRLIERRRLEADAAAKVIELPLAEADRGGFGLSLLVVRDHQLMQQSASVQVPWENKQLELELATFRDELRPGAAETWTVRVKTPDGRPVERGAAEVLAYMFDRSLDALAPHRPPSPLGLFPNRSRANSWRCGLGAAPAFRLQHRAPPVTPAYPSLLPTRLRFYGNRGLGGPGWGGGGRSRNRFGFESAVITGALARPDGSAARYRRGGSDRAGRGAVDEPDQSADADERSAADGRGLRGLRGREPGAQAPVELRSDFAETAFFQPQLLTGEDGAVTIRFEVPDSVTAWNVWIHAVTRELQSASLHEQARSVKELMVRPQLPRFLREGDRAELQVMVNNTAERPLRGELVFTIEDPETGASLAADFGLEAAAAEGRPFEVAAGGSTRLGFAVTAPARVGPVAVRVTARSGSIADGELRPLPVLPGRMHLAQSRFAVLEDADSARLHFADLAADDDPSRIHQQLVVTIDAQLFYSVLAALPYLVEYPYECTEQTLNRFLSTGILTSLYGDYPAVARMAEKLADRPTRLERFDQPDANRQLALEETPWLQQARGGVETDQPLINVLDPRRARAHRITALAQLRQAQTANGAFPWFPGGPPSPFMTLYILHGLSKALEFGVDVPRRMVRHGWRYLHRHFIGERLRRMMREETGWRTITLLNYVLSNYPEAQRGKWTGGVFTGAQRQAMLDFSFKHWKEHSPYLKGLLALSLARAGRTGQARLVWSSVMDAAEQSEEQGTHWAIEDRSWLWYNDTIETHAFALRTAMELTPKDPKVDGLVQWLFAHKKLNHWKSTRATAEVIYALAHYLKKTGRLGVREKTRVAIGDIEREFVFEPDAYTGRKNQLLVAGADIDPQRHATVAVESPTPGTQFASATWHYSTERLPAEARGDALRVERRYFRRITRGGEVLLEPLAAGARIQVGDEVEVQLSLRSAHQMEYVHLRDPRPAGFEPVSQISRHRWRLGLCWYEEVRDSGQNFFFERLPVGEVPFKYRLRAAVAGTFKAAPAEVQPLYAPAFTGFSAGRSLTIAPAAGATTRE